MHLVVLMTNTDESAFAQRHPKDGKKFAAMIHSVRPDWSVTSYAVKDGVFPDSIDEYDGLMITGSPASVHDSDAWVGRLMGVIRTAFDAQMPMFGACYGHQAIAMALGGTVDKNPDGWVFGAIQTQIIAKAEWMQELPDTIYEYGAHIEQVTKLPKGATVLSVTPTCPVAGFRIGNRVYTTQNHPEMTPGFIDALVAEYAPKLPPDVADAAKASLGNTPSLQEYADSIARFFETAAAH